MTAEERISELEDRSIANIPANTSATSLHYLVNFLALDPQGSACPFCKPSALDEEGMMVLGKRLKGLGNLENVFHCILVGNIASTLGV